MAHFLITYDNRPPRNYQALYDLMSNWAAVRLADSVWLAELVGPAPTVRGFVQQALQADDTVAVLELKPGADWATVNVPPQAAEWLSRHISPAQILV